MTLHLSEIDYDLEINDDLYHKCIKSMLEGGFIDESKVALQLELEITLEIQKIYMAKLEENGNLHSYKEYEEKYGKEDFVKAAEEVMRNNLG